MAVAEASTREAAIARRITSIRERIMVAREAAALFTAPAPVLDLAAEAMSLACPAGAAFAFVRGQSGACGGSAFALGGRLNRLGATLRDQPVPFVVNINRVPAWQQARWVEPMRAGVHGPDLFDPARPVVCLDGSGPPAYGRMMVCEADRMVAWAGVYVDGHRDFLEAERHALAGIMAGLAEPLRVAALLADDRAARALAPRQHEIVARLALGRSNKQIARDLDISPATVKTQLERLYRLSGAANRAALVAWWQAGRRRQR
jgi:DNA-binding CsgD family transcriptional regulator